MYHSITIGDKNTWDDWHMIPVTPPVIAPPVEKTLSLNVEGRSGTVYLSQSVTGRPVYKAREGSWEFYISTEEWRGNHFSSPVGKQALDHLTNALRTGAAKPLENRVRLEDDPAFFYFGRVWVSGGIKQQNDHTVVTLKYSLYPYKFLYNAIDEDWLWDPFGFTTDLALPYTKDIRIAPYDKTTVYLPPSEKPSVVYAASEGVKATLYKSRAVPYTYAKILGLAADSVSANLYGKTMTPVGIIDDDLRYNVYELALKSEIGDETSVHVHYQPAYL